MVTALGLVVSTVLLNKVRLVIRSRVIVAATRLCQILLTIFLGALFRNLLFACITFLSSSLIKVAPGTNLWHIIHRHCCRGLNPGINCRGVERNTSPTTNTDNSDSFWINITEVA